MRPRPRPTTSSGTLATDAGQPVDVVTGDRDLFQLVDDEADVRVLYIGRGVSKHERVDNAWVREKYGIDAAQYADFATLRGDASDGLPGVAGVGDKTAATLLNRFGDIAGVLAAVEDPDSDLGPGPARQDQGGGRLPRGGAAGRRRRARPGPRPERHRLSDDAARPRPGDRARRALQPGEPGGPAGPGAHAMSRSCQVVLSLAGWWLLVALPGLVTMVDVFGPIGTPEAVDGPLLAVWIVGYLVQFAWLMLVVPRAVGHLEAWWLFVASMLPWLVYWAAAYGPVEGLLLIAVTDAVTTAMILLALRVARGSTCTVDAVTADVVRRDPDPVQPRWSTTSTSAARPSSRSRPPTAAPTGAS